MPADIDFAAQRIQDAATADDVTAQLAEAGPAIAEKRVVTIPVTNRSISLAIYRPRLDSPLPAHLYFHGGGWVAGSGLSRLPNTRSTVLT